MAYVHLTNATDVVAMEEAAATATATAAAAAAADYGDESAAAAVTVGDGGGDGGGGGGSANLTRRDLLELGVQKMLEEWRYQVMRRAKVENLHQSCPFLTDKS